MVTCGVARMRILLAAVLMLLAAAPLHARDALRVCADPNNLPFSSEDLSGFENKIAAVMGEVMQLPLEYTWFPQRRGFIRKTLKSESRPGVYECDIVMGVPSAYELAAPTMPYYASTWVLVYAKGRGIDDVQAAVDFAALPRERRDKVRLGIFDQGPGQLWAFYNGLMSKAKPYTAQLGHVRDTPMIIIDDIVANKIDAAIIWGPFAGYYAKKKPGGEQLVILSLAGDQDPGRPEMKFVYKISMGVRHPDKEWKEQLNSFIKDHDDKIKAVMEEFGIPLVPLTE